MFMRKKQTTLKREGTGWAGVLIWGGPQEFLLRIWAPGLVGRLFFNSSMLKLPHHLSIRHQLPLYLNLATPKTPSRGHSTVSHTSVSLPKGFPRSCSTNLLSWTLNALGLPRLELLCQLEGTGLLTKLTQRILHLATSD